MALCIECPAYYMYMYVYKECSSFVFQSALQTTQLLNGGRRQGCCIGTMLQRATNRGELSTYSDLPASFASHSQVTSELNYAWYHILN